MALVVLLLFFVLLTAASAVGFVSDSRDGADWTASDAGRRRPAAAVPSDGRSSAR